MGIYKIAENGESGFHIVDVKSFGITEIHERCSLTVAKKWMLWHPVEWYKLYYIMQ